MINEFLIELVYMYKFLYLFILSFVTISFLIFILNKYLKKA